MGTIHLVTTRTFNLPPIGKYASYPTLPSSQEFFLLRI
jgi:hypothetical protein